MWIITHQQENAKVGGGRGGRVGEGKDVTILKRLDKDLYELLFFQENQIIT